MIFPVCVSILGKMGGFQIRAIKNVFKERNEKGPFFRAYRCMEGYFTHLPTPSGRCPLETGP